MNDYLFTDINNLNYIILAIYVLLIVYIVFILPNLNNETIVFFDGLAVKLVSLFIIIYISVSNPILAILLSIAFVLTLQELNKQVQQFTLDIQNYTGLLGAKSNKFQLALNFKKEFSNHFRIA